MCETPEDVHDAVQEALWLISKKIGSLNMISAFFAWSKRIVVRECLKLKTATLRYVGIAEAAEPSYSDSGSLLQDLSKSIEALPLSAREAIVLQDLLGFTTPEAAQYLNLSVEATKSRHRRAREQLRSRLSEYRELRAVSE